MRYVTREEMQEIDRRAIEERKIPVDTLMGNAGKAVADLVEERISRDCPIVAVCGRGDNGGDGFVAARLLGIAVEATATVTMGLPKVGFRAPEARKHVGELVVADIGFPADLLR